MPAVCELSVSSYRCLLVNFFHLKWCSVFGQRTFLKMFWVPACMCEVKSPDSSNWPSMKRNLFAPAKMMTKLFSTSFCHTLGDLYQTESQCDRRVTGSDRVILTGNKNTWVRQMDETTTKIQSLLFFIIFSNFGAQGEVSIPELPLNI